MHSHQVPQEFTEALLSLRDPQLRSEVVLTEIPAPTRLAPYAAALNAEVNLSPQSLNPDDFLGSGRFVLLHNPADMPAWGGSFRVVVLCRAVIDHELGDDPLLGAVGWSWLTDALETHGAGFRNLSGTVTRVMSETFGGLELSHGTVEMEMRASWTPNTTDLAPHLSAWAEALAMCAGLEPVPENVTSLPRRRGR